MLILWYFLFCFPSYCSDAIYNLFWCRHVVFLSGVKTFLMNFLWWWASARDRMMMSFQQTFISSSPGDDINILFF
jgi:hypothetical protein